MNSVIRELIRRRIEEIDKQMDLLADERTLLQDEVNEGLVADLNERESPTLRPAPDRRDLELHDPIEDINPKTGLPYKLSREVRSNMKRAAKKRGKKKG